MGLRAGLDIEVRGKISCLCWGSNFDRPAITELQAACGTWKSKHDFLAS
jgi:hypothetical protein